MNKLVTRKGLCSFQRIFSLVKMTSPWLQFVFILAVTNSGYSFTKNDYKRRDVATELFKSNVKDSKQLLNYSFSNSFDCLECEAGITSLETLIKLGMKEEKIIKLLGCTCEFFNIQPKRVCEGAARVFGPGIIYALKHATVGPNEICGFVLGDHCGDNFSRNHDWNVVFPPVPKPPVRNLQPPSKNVPTMKVLQLSDTHFDPYYEEGANAECHEPLCCRASSGPVLKPEDGAGRWGDYRKCDTPKRTIEHMLKHIAYTQPDIDYIIWTGDLPPHDVWSQTREETLKVIKETVEQMSVYFPGKRIFPAIGNHESVPVNSFPPPFTSPPGSNMSWLYDELDTLWRRWLPADVSHTVRLGAFYSVLVRPGLRIISINMNYCYNYNWWLMLNSKDPVGQLQWLIRELQSAETSGEKVHIIGHIPPGTPDCVQVWSRNYYEIVNRYESTITAQFFGHTHFDEFEVFYDPKDLKRATNIAYVGPSVTPWYNLNPGYALYYVDGDHHATTRLVVDHETWIMNLEEANLIRNPTWHRLYSARDAYSMEALRPQDWDKFISEIESNDDLFNLYYKHFWKNSTLRSACNDDCRKELVCDVRSGRSHDRRVLCGYNTRRDLNRSPSRPPRLSHWFD